MELFQPDLDELFTLKEGCDIKLWRTAEGVKANIPQDLIFHSPTGFEYGYAGSGPADLALNILYQFMNARHAWKYHQAFKFDVVAKLDHSFPIVEIPRHEIRDWIQGHVEELQEDSDLDAVGYGMTEHQQEQGMMDEAGVWGDDEDQED